MHAAPSSEDKLNNDFLLILELREKLCNIQRLQTDLCTPFDGCSQQEPSGIDKEYYEVMKPVTIQIMVDHLNRILNQKMTALSIDIRKFVQPIDGKCFENETTAEQSLPLISGDIQNKTTKGFIFISIILQNLLFLLY